MLIAIACLALLQTTMEQPFARHPDVFGDKVVYTCEGDLWIGDLATHKAARLTRSEGTEYLARFSPDGTEIAYCAEYAGLREIYVIPTAGGVPRRVTYLNQYPELLDWTPDGKSLLFRKNGYASWRAYEVYSIPAVGGVPARMPLEFASAVSPAPDGKRFVFNRFYRVTEPWFRYHGGLKNDVWVFDGKSNFKKIFQSEFTNEYPVWAGDKIAWVNDEGARFTIIASNPDGSGVRKLVGPSEYQIRNLQTDGRRLIYERGRGMEIADLQTGRTEPVRFEMPSDKMHMMPYRVPASALVVGATLGPTGKRALVETRGQIISVPAGEGDVRLVLGKPRVRYQSACFSPDGKKIAFVCDETREQQLYVADADGSNPKQLTTDENRQLKRVAWAPDGKTIALTDSLTRLRLIDATTGKETIVAKGEGWDGPGCTFSRDCKWIAYEHYNRITGTSSIYLYEIATRKSTRLGEGKTNDWSPAFSANGKWLAFLTVRSVTATWDGIFNQLDTGNPTQVCLVALQKETKSPFVIGDEEEGSTPPEQPKATGIPDLQLDGISDREILLPMPTRPYGVLGWAGERVLCQDGGNLFFYDLAGKREGLLAGGIGGWTTSFDGKKLLSQNGAELRVIDTGAEGLPPGSGRLDYAGFELAIQPAQEWVQIYWDSWRIIRDYFYAQNMHGNNWKAVGVKYAQLLPSVRSRDELNILIYWLLAELSVSHAGVDGGDWHGLFRGERPSFLGADLEPDSSGYYKIKTIFRGDGYRTAERSPLAEPGLNVKEGMYLIEVAGIPACTDANFQEALLGRAGQIVAIKVNDEPSPKGARTIRIRPIADEFHLRYLEWARKNREYVDKASGGRLGYIHLQSMVENDVADFALQYFTQRNKEGIIFDDRFNGGGNVSTTITNILKQKVVLWFNNRNNELPTSRQGDAFLGPLVCLMNEYSGSNGEEFPHHFRALKLGPLIGRHTWGGEVGSAPGWHLADGGVVNVPNYGAYEPNGQWAIEGPGLTPDYDIESDPNLWIKGIDPQLDKAIQLLLDEIKKRPKVELKQPPEPVKIGK